MYCVRKREAIDIRSRVKNFRPANGSETGVEEIRIHTVVRQSVGSNFNYILFLNFKIINNTIVRAILKVSG